MRTDIVESTASKLTDGEVHARNRFFVIAKKMGLGVQPKLDEDPYTGTIADRTIEIELRRAFDEQYLEQYLPFTTLLSIKQMLSAPFDEYVGRKNKEDEGYTLKTYGPGFDYLKVLFAEDIVIADYVITDYDETKVLDINWGLILSKIWNTALKKKYFHCATWSSYIKSIGFSRLGNLFKSAEESAILASFAILEEFLVNPTRTYSDDELHKLSMLLTIPIEFISYLSCNPDLPDEVKQKIFLYALDNIPQEKLDDLHNKLWLFADENLILANSFIREFYAKYPEKLDKLEIYVNNMRFVREWLNKASLQKLKVFFSQLQFVSDGVLKSILNNANIVSLLERDKNKHERIRLLINFMEFMNAEVLSLVLERRRIFNYILEKSNGDHEIMILLLNLAQNLDGIRLEDLNIIFMVQKADGDHDIMELLLKLILKSDSALYRWLWSYLDKNYMILFEMLDHSHGHVVFVKQFLNFICSQNDKDGQDALIHKTFVSICDDNSALLQAIKHCPFVFPLMFKMMFQTPLWIQDEIRMFCLRYWPSNSRYGCFRLLLEL